MSATSDAMQTVRDTVAGAQVSLMLRGANDGEREDAMIDSKQR